MAAQIPRALYWDKKTYNIMQSFEDVSLVEFRESSSKESFKRQIQMYYFDH